jgi:hypothetical protein
LNLASAPPYKKVDFEIGKRSALQQCPRKTKTSSISLSKQKSETWLARIEEMEWASVPPYNKPILKSASAPPDKPVQQREGHGEGLLAARATA